MPPPRRAKTEISEPPNARPTRSSTAESGELSRMLGQEAVVAGDAEEAEADDEQAGHGAGAEGDVERRLEPVARRLGRAHVRAHGDVHADEAGGGGEHRADRGSRSPCPSRARCRSRAAGTGRRRRRRSSCTGGAGTRRRPPGSPRPISCMRSFPAGWRSSQTVSPMPTPTATSAQTSANATAWSLKKSIAPPPVTKSGRGRPRRGGFLSQAGAARRAVRQRLPTRVKPSCSSPDPSPP